MKKFIFLGSFLVIANLALCPLSDQEFSNLTHKFEELKKYHQYLSTTSAFLEGDARQFDEFFSKLSLFNFWYRSISEPRKDWILSKSLSPAANILVRKKKMQKKIFFMTLFFFDKFSMSFL